MPTADELRKFLERDAIAQAAIAQRIKDSLVASWLENTNGIKMAKEAVEIMNSVKHGEAVEVRGRHVEGKAEVERFCIFGIRSATGAIAIDLPTPREGMSVEVRAARIVPLEDVPQAIIEKLHASMPKAPDADADLELLRSSLEELSRG